MSMVVRFSARGVDDRPIRGSQASFERGGALAPGRTGVSRLFRRKRSASSQRVWSSNEQFEAFGQHLMPILNDVGINFAGPPERLEIYNQERF